MELPGCLDVRFVSGLAASFHDPGRELDSEHVLPKNYPYGRWQIYLGILKWDILMGFSLWLAMVYGRYITTFGMLMGY